MPKRAFLTLLALVSAAGAGCGEETCPDGTLEGLCAAPTSSEELVDPAWLEAHLDDGDLQIVDIRSLGQFESAHIPGAVHLDANLLRDTVMGVAGQVASQVDIQTALSNAGVRDDARLIVYSTSLDTTAARVWWTLLYHQHLDAQVLDGGFGAWMSAGGATESGATMPTPSGYAIGAADDTLRVDATYVESQLGSPDVVLVDARAAGEYDLGHVPGALNVDWNANVVDGSLRPIDELEPLYAGIAPGATVIAYCQTGSRGSVAFLVLRRLGFTDVRLYDGSWAEWSADPMRPVEP